VSIPLGVIHIKTFPAGKQAGTADAHSEAGSREPSMKLDSSHYQVQIKHNEICFVLLLFYMCQTMAFF